MYRITDSKTDAVDSSIACRNSLVFRGLSVDVVNLDKDCECIYQIEGTYPIMTLFDVAIAFTGCEWASLAGKSMMAEKQLEELWTMVELLGRCDLSAAEACLEKIIHAKKDLPLGTLYGLRTVKSDGAAVYLEKNLYGVCGAIIHYLCNLEREKGLRLKTCKNCGAHYLTDNPDTNYCDDCAAKQNSPAWL